MRQNSGYRTVDLENVKKNSIVVVDLSKELPETVFAREYKQAAKIISEIIAYNNNNESEDRTASTEGIAERTSPNVNRSGFHTAVPFIGDRGTGKTSMMCSVLQYLKKSKHGLQPAAFPLKSGNASFITLDMIDANTLKNTEDLLEIILSRMFAYLEKFNENNRFRELYRKIDALYKDLSQIYWNKAFAPGDSGLESLKHIADSQKSINRFQSLVKHFVSEVSREEKLSEPAYLVLALDDIDMYQGSRRGLQSNQFSLLEEIYDYMRVPRLIVLMTYNENILKRNCNTHFRRTYFGKDTEENCTHTELEEIEVLTRQFMAKLFPHEQRVYLPNLTYVDSADRPNLYIKLPSGAGVEQGSDASAPSGEALAPVKEFMLRMIAQRTGVFFDVAGTKKHFFEPRNLRELGTLYQVISSMEEISEPDGEPKKEDNERKRARNRQLLLDYLRNQFAGERLKAEEYRRFQALSMLPLIRQERTFVDRVRQHRMDVVDQEDSLGYLAKTKRDRWKYSYGELLHNIYYATRIPRSKGSEDFYYSKEYVHCILGAHSVMMNQTPCREEREGAADAQDDWVRIMGSSISGRWANDMLPDFFVDADRTTDKKVEAGSISLPIRSFLNWKLPSEVQDALLNLGRGDVSGEDKKTVSQFMETMILIGMLFTGFPQSGLKIQLEAEVEQNALESGGALYLRSSSEDHICFNVFNFVINLYVAIHPYHMGEGQKTYFQYMRKKLYMLGQLIATQLERNYAGMWAEAWQARDDAEKRAEQLMQENGSPSTFNIFSESVQKYAADADRARAWAIILGQGDPAKSNDRAGTAPPDSRGVDARCFITQWNSLLKKLLGEKGDSGDYPKRVKKWESEHEEFPFALPVQHFDMMYNIIKRLTNVYYHDIPEEAPIEEVCVYFSRLYENVGEELERQDNAYFPAVPGFEPPCRGFAEAYRSTLFYQEFNANDNPYIQQLLTSILRTAVDRIREPGTQIIWPLDRW